MSGININSPAAFEQEVVYKECRHNHAASLGRVSFDGCREFLKPGTRDVVDGGSKEAMLCVACGCHRNFHRKDTVYNPIMTAATATPQTHHQPGFYAAGAGPSASATRVVQFINQGTTLMNAAATAGNDNNTEEGPVVPPPEGRKKRTMFTAEQRSRMVRFAERLGWRPQRSDKEEIQHFCLEMGISRRMFLVWLSNNRRRVVQNNTTSAAAV